ncbi:hypothetical protein TNCV_2754371 [Trichonephila clavipes]|nr:hypothetical protein TNCV_2754371 [Trichonephila clavipes]
MSTPGFFPEENTSRVAIRAKRPLITEENPPEHLLSKTGCETVVSLSKSYPFWLEVSTNGLESALLPFCYLDQVGGSLFLSVNCSRRVDNTFLEIPRSLQLVACDWSVSNLPAIHLLWPFLDDDD